MFGKLNTNSITLLNSVTHHHHDNNSTNHQFQSKSKNNNQLILAAYGTHLYIFNKFKHLCEQDIELGHQVDILALHICNRSSGSGHFESKDGIKGKKGKEAMVMYTVDQSGVVIKTQININSNIGVNDMNKLDDSETNNNRIQYKVLSKYNCIQKSQKTSTKKDKNSSITQQNKQIKSAQFLNNQTLLYILQSSITTSPSNNKLYSYNIQLNALTNLQPQLTFNKILTNKNKNSDSHRVYVLENDGKCVHIYQDYHNNSGINEEGVQDSQMKGVVRYVDFYKINGKHEENITAVCSVGDILAVGDSRGKITLIYNYFNNKKNSNMGNTKNGNYSNCVTVLEWHTGPVLSLCSNGSYLYSAGQQSVVVLWHTRDLNRDFLPKIGTSITSITVCEQSNAVLCSLSDNSMKLIDISDDKQTYNYKTIIDPSGTSSEYSSSSNVFSAQTTCFYNNTLCLNSLPGRLQFLQFNKNGNNYQLQVVNRNLTNSIDGDVAHPHKIVSLCFSPTWNYLIISISTESYINTNSQIQPSYLKFYTRTANGYQLTTRIDNPHQCPATTIHHLTSSSLPLSSTKFLTLSQQDKKINIWSQHTEKKKSIIDATQKYWRCQQYLEFRNLCSTHVVVGDKGYLLAVYANMYIVVYQSGEEIKEVQHFCYHGKIKHIETVNMESKNNGVVFKILVVKFNNQVQITTIQFNNNNTNKNNNKDNSDSKKKSSNKKQTKQTKQDQSQQKIKIHINQRLNLGQLTHPQSFIIKGNLQLSLFTSFLNKNNETNTSLLIIDRKSSKFTQSYNIDTKISTAFYIDSITSSQKNNNNNKLILIDKKLKMTALDNKPFIKYQAANEHQKEGEQHQNYNKIQEQQSMQTRYIENDLVNINLYKLNTRWIQREAIKNKSKIFDCISDIQYLPNCASAWQQISEKMLL